jgi:molybdate transport system substrate-binding protein
MTFYRAIAAAIGIWALPLFAPQTQAADIKLLEGNALNAVVGELGPQYEKATENKIVATLGTSAQLKTRIDGGEAFDAVLLTATALDQLAAAGKIAPASQLVIARVGVGIAIKKGAPKPDLSTVDSFKQAMLNAKSVGFVDQTPTAVALRALFVKLGIADAMQAKIKPLTVAAAVAVSNGDVEIGMTQISEILPYPGVELAGPLPRDIQTYTEFSGGLSAATKNANAATTLIKFLQSPEARAVIKSRGMEPG